MQCKISSANRIVGRCLQNLQIDWTEGGETHPWIYMHHLSPMTHLLSDLGPLSVPPTFSTASQGPLIRVRKSSISCSATAWLLMLPAVLAIRKKKREKVGRRRNCGGRNQKGDHLEPFRLGYHLCMCTPLRLVGLFFGVANRLEPLGRGTRHKPPTPPFPLRCTKDLHPPHRLLPQ